jgi:N-acetyl-alpha-D-muramate 1-phosphate uridylyltransferase
MENLFVFQWSGMLPIAVIAGGLGTRLAPITQTVPKALVPVNGRPFIDYQLELLRQHGVTEVVLCVSYLGEMIEEYVGNGERYGCSVRYSYDGAQRIGTAGALAKARPLLGPAFFMTYGDSYLSCDYAAIEASFIASGKPALMTVFGNDGALVPSNVLYRDATIVAYEKASPLPAMHHVDYGLSAFNSGVFDNLPLDRPTDLAEVFHRLIAANALAGYEISTRFYEVGTPDGITETEGYLRALSFPQA